MIIEKVYNWYRDKRKILLDNRITVKFPEESLAVDSATSQQQQQQPVEQQAPTMVQQKPSQPPTTVPSLQLHGQTALAGKQQQQVVQDANTPYFANTEKKRHIFINNRMKQFSTRNLMQSAVMRDQKNQKKKQQQQQHVHISNNSATPPPPPTITNEDDAKLAEQASRRLAYLLKEAPGETFNKVLFDDDDAAFAQEKFNRQAQSVQYMLYHKKAEEERQRSLQVKWLQHRVQEAQETLEEADKSQTLHAWAANRARVEEEIQRRQESFTYSSQTGTRVHSSRVIMSDELQKESRFKKQRLMELKQKNTQYFLDSSEEDEDDDANAAMEENEKHSMYTDRTMNMSDAGTAADASVLTAVTPHNYYLSPYVHLSDNMENASSTEHNTIHNPDTPAKLRGLVRPNYVHDQMNNLDLTHINPDSKFSALSYRSLPATPKQARWSARPASAVTWTNNNLLSSRSSHIRPMTSPQTMVEPSHNIPSSTPVVQHNVMDEMDKIRQELKVKRDAIAQAAGKESARPTSAKSSGKRSATPKKKSAKKKKKKSAKSTSAKDDHAAKQKALALAALAEPALPPSMHRTQQLDQCEQIKVALAGKGVWFNS